MIVFGAGGLVIQMLDHLIKNQDTNEVFLVIDDEYSKPRIDLPDFFSINYIVEIGNLNQHLYLCGIGDPYSRQKKFKWVEERKYKHYTLISDNCEISSLSSVHQGSIVLSKSIIEAKCTIGQSVLINVGVNVHHESKIGDFSVIGPGSIILGNVSIGEGVNVGAGTIILPNIKIGDWCIIGAGAVITKDLPPNSKVKGVPAKPF